MVIAFIVLLLMLLAFRNKDTIADGMILYAILSLCFICSIVIVRFVGVEDKFAAIITIFILMAIVAYKERNNDN